MPRRRPFQYDALLRVRQRQEDVCAQEMAAAQRDVRDAEHQRDAIAREKIHVLENAGTQVMNLFAADDVRRYYQYERHLAFLATKTDARLHQLRQSAEERRAELENAMKRRRTIERLKERRQHDFLAELEKDEQAAIDEAASNYAAMKRHRVDEDAGEAGTRTKRGVV